MASEREIYSATTVDAALEQHQTAMALAGAGRYSDAVERYRRALALRPDYPEAHNNLGNALYALGRPVEAVAHYRRTLELLPGAAIAHNNLAKALTELGAHEEAERSFRRALELRPDYPEAHNDLATLYQRCARLEEAVLHYGRALDLGFAQAHGNLANALKELGRRGEAERHYRLAIEAQPDSAAARVDFGLLLRDNGMMDEAKALFRRALELDPDHAGARWAAAMTCLPVVPESQTAAMRGRAEFEAEIDELETWFDELRVGEGWRAVGFPQPFYLAYHETNNRELLSRYGRLCARLMQRCQPESEQFLRPPKTGAAVRLGIASAHLVDHSVWRLIKGWLKFLDRGKFELYLISLNPRRDQETNEAISLSTHFEIGERSLPRWADTIRNFALDVLLFPEIGMDPSTVKLASLRLAPVQVAWGGHPETTGLPTIDYFLSAEGMEPDNAQENYSEQLITLPGLGCCYEPSPVANVTPNFKGMGIDPQLPLLICPGTPFKYAPEHDWVLAEIARKLGRCQMIFFRDADGLSGLLRARLKRTFAEAGLDLADHAVFVPWQPIATFHGLMRRADVFLDTIGFSGFNTAMQAVECSLPIVSREGRFMRGRLASGILKRIGLQELVTASEGQYVDLAVKLAADTAYRNSIRGRMMASRAVLFRDLATVRALEDFLLRVARRQ